MARHLLSLSGLEPDALDRLLDLAATMKADPLGRRDALAGQVVVLHFTKASTRTRISFEAAIARLGGTPIFTRPDELQLGRGEPIADTARVLSRYAAAVVIRTFAHADVEEFARWSTIPVVNALTDAHHPCQALADLLTLRERFGALRGLPVAYVGDGNNNVTHSLIEACALAGVDLTVASPAGHEPDARIVAGARDAAARSGGQLEVVRDPREAVAHARAVYTDVFVSMGQEGEAAAKLAAFAGYQVDEALLAGAADDAVFLHCLPAHRGEEVSDAVIEGARSAVWDQAENRLHTAAAVLLDLTGTA